MYYGAYKNLRNSAWQCLLDCGITKLPIDVRAIAKQAGIHIVQNSAVNELLPTERGKSFFYDNRWIIIYDDRYETTASRYTIAHELGHIFLGHELQQAFYDGTQMFHKKPQAEQYADRFAIRLLCPACVLWGLDLHTTDEIAAYCRIDKEQAEPRAQRMKLLYDRQKFLTSELEQKVFENFHDYIQQERRKIQTERFALK